MKKKIILMALTFVSLFGCSKSEIDDNKTIGEGEYNAKLTVSVPKTKVTISEDNIKLSWNNDDEISVLTSKGVYKTFVYKGDNGVSTAEFKGRLDDGESIGTYALYPANPNHTINDGIPSFNLPAEYQWNKSEVMGPMLAVVSDGNAMFTHIGGLFAFDVKNLPVGTKGFRFSTSAKTVTGVFAYDGVVIRAGDSEDGSHITLGFDPLKQACDMKFYIPVPVGSYEDFTISYISSDGTETAIRSSSAMNVIEAATVKLFTVRVKDGSYYVTAGGSVEMDGLSWETATTLENALSMAEDGDVVHIAAGVYKPQNALNYSDAPEEEGFKNFLVNKNVTLIGGYPATPSVGAVADPSVNRTILDGDSKAYHTLIVSAAKVADKKVVIDGITVKGGNAAKPGVKFTCNGATLNGGQGGGIAFVGTSAEMNNVIVSDNSAAGAGGVFSAVSKVKMTGCTITANKVTGAGNGGGAWFTTGSELEMDACYITKNEAANAGGLYLYTGAGKVFPAVIKNTTIAENTATEKYGGSWLRDDSGKHLLQASFDNCTIMGNSAKLGSAVYNINASATYTSCEFSENKNTGGNGVIMFYENCIALLDKCTIKENTLTAGAGVVFVYTNAPKTNPKVTIINSSFVNNVASSNTGALWLRGDNGKVTCNCVNNTFSGNTAAREGAVFAYKTGDVVNLVSNTITGNKGFAVNVHTASVNSYNNIISGNTDNKDVNGTVSHKCSIVGTSYFDAEGLKASLTPEWNVSTMLGSLNSDGVCLLLLPEANPAYTYGMSSSQLQTLANDYISAEVLSKDQLGNSRNGNVIGAYVAK